MYEVLQGDNCSLEMSAAECESFTTVLLSCANRWPGNYVIATSQDLSCNFTSSFRLTREMPLIVLLVGFNEG